MHSPWISSATSLFFFILLIISCGPQGSSQSTLSDIAFDREAKNVALLFAAPANLSGPPTDIAKMKELLEDPNEDYGFKVYTLNRATLPEIISMTEEHAQEAETLFWYFSGHGAQDGSLAAEDDLFQFNTISESIKNVRQTPLKRFIAMVDICFAGNIVDGNTPIITEPDAETGSHKYSSERKHAGLIVERIFDSFQKNTKTYDADLYEQAIAFASSTKDESSLDMGAEHGGAFTYAFRNTFEKLKREAYETATLRDLLTQTSQTTEGHTPVWRAYPAEAILDDLVFKVTNLGPEKKLFALLGPPQSSGEISLYVSAGKELVTKVSLCVGEPVTCKNELSEDVNLTLLKNIDLPERFVFKTEVPLEISLQDTFTLLGFDHENKLIASQGITFEIPETDTSGGDIK